MFIHCWLVRLSIFDCVYAQYLRFQESMGATHCAQWTSWCMYITFLNDIHGLFRQSLNGTGTWINWLAWYSVEVFTLHLQLYLCLYSHFGISSVPVQFPVPLKFCLIKPSLERSKQYTCEVYLLFNMFYTKYFSMTVCQVNTLCI